MVTDVWRKLKGKYKRSDWDMSCCPGSIGDETWIYKLGQYNLVNLDVQVLTKTMSTTYFLLKLSHKWTGYGCMMESCMATTFAENPRYASSVALLLLWLSGDNFGCQVFTRIQKVKLCIDIWIDSFFSWFLFYSSDLLQSSTFLGTLSHGSSLSFTLDNSPFSFAPNDTYDLPIVLASLQWNLALLDHNSCCGKLPLASAPSYPKNVNSVVFDIHITVIYRNRMKGTDGNWICA